jgi:hypothetical protein
VTKIFFEAESYMANDKLRIIARGASLLAKKYSGATSYNGNI